MRTLPAPARDRRPLEPDLLIANGFQKRAFGGVRGGAPETPLDRKVRQKSRDYDSPDDALLQTSRSIPPM
ncbi:hypothetical protein AAJCM20276_02090 [Acetobacter aceti]|uniref:Uncharacterized protein n=1 Tax=Acetobacter aceti TaxID=435 RepID=A0A6S6PG60_ACEAC|nr:hypothetical protein AAJCM20276_02090 [Acetobacter aceti]